MTANANTILRRSPCAQYRYLVFLFLITALAVIMCQYSPYAPPGHHGAVRTLAWARVRVRARARVKACASAGVRVTSACPHL